jgi:hypothetical protein
LSFEFPAKFYSAESEKAEKHGLNFKWQPRELFCISIANIKNQKSAGLTNIIYGKIF